MMALPYLQVLLPLVSHGFATGCGPVAFAQAAALRANETRTSATSARIRWDMKTSAHRLGVLAISLQTCARRRLLFRAFLRHHRAILRHLCRLGARREGTAA
jgi:hypothetical protein